MLHVRWRLRYRFRSTSSKYQTCRLVECNVMVGDQRLIVESYIRQELELYLGAMAPLLYAAECERAVSDTEEVER